MRHFIASDLMRLAALAASLPAGSPARIAAAYRLKVADAEFNLFTRLCIMLGAAGHPFTEVARAKREGAPGLVNRIKSLKPELPNLDPEWFDNRNANHPNFYNILYGAALKRVRDPEKAMELLSVATAGADDAHGNLAYQLGKSLGKRDGLTDLTLTTAANALAHNISSRGLDVLRSESRRNIRDTAIDAPVGGDEDSRSLSDTLTNSEPMELMHILLDTPQGREVLQAIDNAMDFTSAPMQKVVWEALKDKPALYRHDQDMAKEVFERTGEVRAPQRMGQLAREVIQKAQDAVNTDGVQRVLLKLQEMSRTRRASAKKKRLAALLQTASLVKTSYDKGMLDDALKLLTETDTAMHDLADVLDARHGGEGSVADTFNTASDLSKWLRSRGSKEFNSLANEFRAQVRKAK